MRELERRQKTRKIIYSTPALVLLALIVAILARSSFGAIKKEQESSEKAKELDNRAVSLEDRQAELEKDINRINTEAGIEEEIRSKLNVSKDEESFVVLVDSEENKTLLSSSTRPWYKKWWSMLKNLR